jgi:hypothetical protein
MKSRSWPIGLITLGVIAILAGWLWPLFVKDSQVWNAANAKSLTDATLNLHEQLHAHGHVHEEGFGHHHDEDEHARLTHPDAIAASKRYREAQAELEAAKFWYASAPVYLRWGGLMLCAAGLATHFAGRSSGG